MTEIKEKEGKKLVEKAEAELEKAEDKMSEVNEKYENDIGGFLQNANLYRGLVRPLVTPNSSFSTSSISTTSTNASPNKSPTDNSMTTTILKISGGFLPGAYIGHEMGKNDVFDTEHDKGVQEKGEGSKDGSKDLNGKDKKTKEDDKNSQIMDEGSQNSKDKEKDLKGEKKEDKDTNSQSVLDAAKMKLSAAKDTVIGPTDEKDEVEDAVKDKMKFTATSVAGSDGGSIKEKLEGIGQQIDEAIKLVGESIKEGGNMGQDVIDTVNEKMKTARDKTAEFKESVIEKEGKELLGKTQKELENVKDRMSEVVDQNKNYVDDGLKKLNEELKTAKETITEISKKKGKDLTDAVEDLKEKAKSAIS
ncbi:hypothetical protein JTE90_016467 [Oedothorax gibbosus]|uniref:Uncharacterized protein n=1 Tax=Oedothorax gibbosus TaxID=931172 RepID=A0AAV6V4L7_9ARAC|nr:hypothetical protein JTE90_016467 [Oedothorax gibbosus]